MSILEIGKIKNNTFLSLNNLRYRIKYLIAYSSDNNIIYWVTNCETVQNDITKILSNINFKSVSIKENPRKEKVFFSVSEFLDIDTINYIYKKVKSNNCFLVLGGTIKNIIDSSLENVDYFSLSNFVTIDALGLSEYSKIDIVLSDMENLSKHFIDVLDIDGEEKIKYFSKMSKEDYYHIIKVKLSDHINDNEIVLDSFEDETSFLNYLVKNKVPYKIIKEIIDKYDLRTEYIIGAINTEEFRQKIYEVRQNKSKYIYGILQDFYPESDTSIIFFEPAYFVYSLLSYTLNDYPEENTQLENYFLAYNTYSEELRNTYFKKPKYARIPVNLDFMFLVNAVNILLYSKLKNKEWFESYVSKNLERLKNIAAQDIQNPHVIVMKNRIKFVLELFEYSKTGNSSTEFKEMFKTFWQEFLGEIVIESEKYRYHILQKYLNNVYKLETKNMSLSEILFETLKKEPDILLPLLLWYIFEALSKKNVINLSNVITDLSAKRKKSKIKASVVVSTDKVLNEYELFLEKVRSQGVFGTKFSLAVFIVMFVMARKKKGFSLSGVTYDFIDSLSAGKKFFMSIDYLDNIHSNLSRKYAHYNLTHAFYELLNDKKNLLLANLFQHQENAKNKICTAYKNGYEGFLLAHATGSGKTITIAKALDCILEQKPDAKVLFISKPEIVTKLSKEIPFLCDKFNYMNVIEKEEDLLEIIENPSLIQQFMGVSYMLLSRALKDTTSSGLVGDINVEETDLEGEDETNLEDTDEDENIENTREDEILSYMRGLQGEEVYEELKIKKKKIERKSLDVIKVVKFFQNFDVIVIDEAHYIKNLNIMSKDFIFRQGIKKRKSSNTIFGIDFRFTDFYTGVGTSKIAMALFLTKFLRNKYVLQYKFLGKTKQVILEDQNQINNIKDIKSKDQIVDMYYVNDKRIFYLLSSGTVMPNWPHDVWLLYYLIGLDENFIKSCPHEFASYYFGAEIKGTTIIPRSYLTNVNTAILKAIEQGLELNIENLLNVMPINNIQTYKDELEKYILSNRIDIFSEKDAVDSNLLKEINRKVYKYNVGEKILNILESLRIIINEERLSEEHTKSISEYLFAILLEIQRILRENSSKKGKSSNKKYKKIKNINTEMRNLGSTYMNEIKNILIGKNIYGNIERYIKRIAEINYKSDSERQNVEKEMMKLLKKTIYGASFVETILDKEISMSKEVFLKEIKPDHREIMSNKALFVDLEKQIINVRTFMQNNHKILSNIVKSAKNSLVQVGMLKIGEITRYVLLEHINNLLKLDIGEKTGQDKVFVAVNHIYPGYLIYIAYVEFLYNIYVLSKNQEIDLKEMLDKIVRRVLMGALGLGLAINSERLGISPAEYIETVMPIINEYVEAENEFVQNVVEDINKSDTINTKHFSECVRFINRNLAIYRLSKFILALSRIGSSPRRAEIENIVIKYMVNSLFLDYGNDIFIKTNPYISSYIGGSLINKEQNTLSLLNYIDVDIQNNIKEGIDLFSYLNIYGYITEDTRDNAISEYDSEVRRISTTLFSNVNDDSEGIMESIVDTFEKNVRAKENVVSKYKNILSNRFLYDPNLKVVIASTKSLAEGLDFNNASAMFILEMSYSSGLLSQVEARINRINTTNDFDIYYITSDISVENRMLDFIVAKDFLSKAVMTLGKDIWKSMLEYETYTPNDVSREQIFRDFIDRYNSAHNRFYSVSIVEDRYLISVNKNQENINTLKEAAQLAMQDTYEESLEQKPDEYTGYEVSKTKIEKENTANTEHEDISAELTDIEKPNIEYKDTLSEEDLL